VRGFGRFNDPETDSRKEGELYTRTVIWYSWFQNGESYPVTVQGRVDRCGFLPAVWPAQIRWVFTINTGGGFEPFINDRVPTGEVVTHQSAGGFTAAVDFTIDGYTYCAVSLGPQGGTCPSDKERTIRDGSALRVDMIGTFPLSTLGDRLFARDEVNLRSALPEVRFGQGSYKIGDTALVHWEIPVVDDLNGQRAYFLTILDMNTGSSVGGWNRKPLESTTGTAQIPVTASMFTISSTCQNRLRAIIYSQLIRADLDETAIQAPIDAVLGVGPAPTVSSVGFDKPEYFEGDTVTISYAGTGTITKWHVTAHIGGLEVYDKDTTESEVTFSAPVTGILEVFVTAYNECQPSTVFKATADVGNVLPDFCEAFPDHPACKDGGGDAAFASLILGIVLAVGGFLVFLFLGTRHIVFVIVGLLITFAGVVLIAFAIVEIVTGLVPFL
jgi:hypothetical protein